MTEAALVKLLRDPELYPSRPENVDVIQTHISIVCLAGVEVYKLKKHVSFPFVDFSTLQARRDACEDELRLNRRLCPSVYHRVIPLRLHSDDNRLSWGEGPGQLIDYAVVMSRLPESEMLDRRIAQGRVSVDEMRSLAQIMVSFHRRAARDEDVKRAGAPAALERFALANFAELRSVGRYVLNSELLDHLETVTQTDFEEFRALLEDRSTHGHVVEGHGDLHTRNICLTDPISIFDCIEFSKSLRCGDVATENAFLVMDLWYRERPDLADAYLKEYLSLVDDEEQPRLIPMLVRYRALVRAKVAALSATEDDRSDDERVSAQASARKYVLLASGASLAERRAVWFLGCGLPGSGKSTFLARLSAAAALPLVSSDQVRKKHAGVSATTRLAPESYTAAASRVTYELTLDAAHRACRAGSVIVDAGFRTREERGRAIEAARAAGARPIVVWLRPSGEQNRAWLEKRSSDHASVSDAGLAVFEHLATEFEPPGEAEAVVIEVDPTRNILDELERVLVAALDQPS